MANYSKDTDLDLYVRNISSFPLPLDKEHDEAYRHIRGKLLREGVTEDTLDALDSDTLASLKPPACHYALYLFFQSHTGDPAMLERAKHHLGEYSRTIAGVEIETTAGATESRSSGKMMLG